MNLTTYDKILFVAAAAFNISAAATLILSPNTILGRLKITDPQAKILARSMASSVLAWGIAYACIVIDPVRFREFVLLGIFSKTIFFVVYSAAFFRKEIDFKAYVPAVIDLILAVLFAEYWMRSR
jgi:hypothetical protein